MRDPYVEDLLDRFVPPLAESGDWEEVLRRAGFSKRRARIRWVVAVATLAVAFGITIPLGITQEWWIFPSFPTPDDVVGEPVATGPRALLAAGEISGRRWTYTAYTSDHGICIDVAVARGSGGGCGFGIRGEPPVTAHGGAPPGRHWVGTGTTALAGIDAVFADGPIAKRVDTVEIVLSDGGAVSADVIAGPSELGAPLDFYLAILPPDSTVQWVVARDAAGTVLERRRVD